ncbi:hypothetical protein [Butyrivibrio sp. AE3004]|uniref:hypothetical protein n=1 Tax=Butyrivibrio sp. AE3004 TaxID=1506994 RepID=UPI000A98490F|nr:hypothetical protein [Butyrivibrio sp. AE3004]
MRIANSTVNLVSERRFHEAYSITKEKGVVSSISDMAGSFKNLLTGINGETNESNKAVSDEKKGEEKLFTNYNSDGGYAVSNDSPFMSKMSDIENLRMQIMEKLLNIMQILYEGMASGSSKSRMQEYMRGLSEKMSAGSYQWMSVTTTTYIHTQEEHTAFTAKGIAKTEDGRELNFGINVSMSRQFNEAIGVMHASPMQLIDPLVINIGNSVTEISDQSFTFDLDADGSEDTVKSLAPGCGFLAYDKNGDGIINDGSELFGALSGNGFTELSKYNTDGNDWIDENDEIYEKLRVWCRGEDGKDTLMTLKEADVGAIYLKHAETEFTSQGNDFMVNAKYKSSGIFLRESTGEAGVVHQIDLAKMA